MTRTPDPAIHTGEKDTARQTDCGTGFDVVEVRVRRPIVTLRRATRILGLIAATVLAVPLIGWQMAPTILPIISPFIAITNILAAKAVGWVAICSLPILISAVLSRRWFCRYLCPMGVITDCASKHRHGRRILQRLPNIAPLIILLTWSGALIGLPLMNWIDPMVIFSGAVGVDKGWVFTIGLGFAVFLSLLIPSIWCLKICPLGAVQDLTSRLARTISRTFRPLMPPDHIGEWDDEEEEEAPAPLAAEPWGDDYDDSLFDVRLASLEAEQGSESTDDANDDMAARRTRIDEPKSPAPIADPSKTSATETSPDQAHPPYTPAETFEPDTAQTISDEPSPALVPTQPGSDQTHPEKIRPPQPERSQTSADDVAKPSKDNDGWQSVASRMNRRGLLLILVGLATVAVGLFARLGRSFAARTVRLRPPGAVDDSLFLALCLRCGNCVAACPQKIIRASTALDRPLEFGTPVIDFHGDGYCDSNCAACGPTPCQCDSPCGTACSTACPSGAIRTIGSDQLPDFPIGQASIDANWCILADNRECKICGRECQYDAITFVWSDEHYTLTPVVDPQRCNGCARCVVACPADRNEYPGGPDMAPSEKAITIIPRSDEIPSRPAGE